jgi:hypothetical protein
MKTLDTVLVPPTSLSHLDSKPILTIPHPKCKWWVVYKMWAFSTDRLEFDAELTGLVEGGEVPEEVGRVEIQRSEPTASGISSDEDPVYSLGTSRLSFPFGFEINICTIKKTRVGCTWTEHQPSTL